MSYHSVGRIDAGIDYGIDATESPDGSSVAPAPSTSGGGAYTAPKTIDTGPDPTTSYVMPSPTPVVEPAAASTYDTGGRITVPQDNSVRVWNNGFLQNTPGCTAPDLISIDGVYTAQFLAYKDCTNKEAAALTAAEKAAALKAAQQATATQTSAWSTAMAQATADAEKKRIAADLALAQKQQQQLAIVEANRIQSIQDLSVIGTLPPKQTLPQTQQAGMLGNMKTMLLVGAFGVGAYFLYKAMKKRK